MFKGRTRDRALDLCEKLGASFSGLTSSWAPFLVATASSLLPNGRMAFVVPAEIGHAPYAAPLLEYLVGHFGAVQIIAIREKLFPRPSEDCWLLFAAAFGSSTREIGFTALERFEPTCSPPEPSLRVSVREWRDLWKNGFDHFSFQSRRSASIARFPKNRTLGASVTLPRSESATSAEPISSSTYGLRKLMNGRSRPVSCILPFETVEHCPEGLSRKLLLRAGDARMSLYYYCASRKTPGRYPPRWHAISIAMTATVREAAISAVCAIPGIRCQMCKYQISS